MVNIRGTIMVNGRISIGAGSRVEVAKNATLSFNGKVANCAGVTIECQDQISIGDNTVISWNKTIIDCDFHYVKDTRTGKTKPMHIPIEIGKTAGYVLVV